MALPFLFLPFSIVLLRCFLDHGKNQFIGQETVYVLHIWNLSPGTAHITYNLK